MLPSEGFVLESALKSNEKPNLLIAKPAPAFIEITSFLPVPRFSIILLAKLIRFADEKSKWVILLRASAVVGADIVLATLYIVTETFGS